MSYTCSVVCGANGVILPRLSRPFVFFGLSSQVTRVSTDDFVVHTHLNVLGKAEMSVGKLKEVYSNLQSKFYPCYANKTGTPSADHAQLLDFCKGKLARACFFRLASFSLLYRCVFFRFDEVRSE